MWGSGNWPFFVRRNLSSRQAASLRRHYPDQVLRVGYTPLSIAAPLAISNFFIRIGRICQRMLLPGADNPCDFLNRVRAGRSRLQDDIDLAIS